MTQEMQVYSGGLTAYAVPVAEIKAQVNLIQHVMRDVMKSGEHYGTIPGCGDKPTLLKAGAEKIAMTFRLATDIEVESTDLGGGHREVMVKVTLVSPEGQRLGSGVGTCSTMEGKYRYRQEVVPGAAVPKEYWDTRDPALLGGANRKPQKRDRVWVVVERVDHDNPADYYNTVLKMAKKRALVDAVLTTTAASDLFTQDVEDMGEVLGTAPAQPKQEPPKSGTTLASESQIASIIELSRHPMMPLDKHMKVDAWLQEHRGKITASAAETTIENLQGIINEFETAISA